MNTSLGIYIAYFLISLGMTIWVARTLHKNGRIFLVDAFSGNQQMADSVNHLLVVGFYLVNIGFILLFLRVGEKPTDLVQGVEYISTKLGIVMLVLGGMHFFNMFNFSKMRKKAIAHNPPPIQHRNDAAQTGDAHAKAVKFASEIENLNRPKDTPCGA